MRAAHFDSLMQNATTSSENLPHQVAFAIAF
jgi:hypothetical protein